ncbi:hypothetical protein Tco_1504595, partial [Tanacetum coccineum]
RNCPAYLAELIKKKKQVGTASSSDVFIIELFSFPTKSWVYDTSCGTHICNTKHGLGEARKLKQGALYLGVVSVHRLVENGFVQCFTDFRISVSKNNVHYFNVIPSNGIYEIDMHDLVPNVNSIYNVSTKRAKHNLDSTYLWHCRLAHISLGIEALVKQISPDRTPTKIRMLFEKNLITQEVSGRAIDLEEIQDEDTSPSEIISEIPMEVKGFEPPKEEEILICRSERSRRVPNRLCLNVEAEEHNLGDLNEHTSYKAAMLDPESNKWLDAMNAEMQSMIDNMVWVLVDLPPNFKTVRSK